MKESSDFIGQYFTAIQTLALLADTQDLYCELGRGSGKTTHILGPRMDRVQHSMPGSVQVFLASTFKAIFENLVPGLMEYFCEHYQRGYYFEIGKRPPAHFAPCKTLITDWHHTISFCNGTVIQFVSCERPEQANGKNIAHLYMDEMLHIKQRVVDENVKPSLRAKATNYFDSPYFMGITGTTSTPNIETDEDWFLAYHDHNDMEKIQTIQKLAMETDKRLYQLQVATIKGDSEKVRKLTKYCQRLQGLLTQLRRGTSYYLRASSISNIKVLGADYIRKQMDSTLDETMLNTSIFAVRQNRVKDMFFGKFGPKYINTDSYNENYYEGVSLSDMRRVTCADMKHCNLDGELYIGYDPGPFSSLVVGQYSSDRQTMYILKCFWVYWPAQQVELAAEFARFFAPMRCKTIFMHYDRAGNQHDPKWKEYKPYFGDTGDTDAFQLRDRLRAHGFDPELMSLNQSTIRYRQHLRLLSHLFSGEEDHRVREQRVVDIRIDENECDALISSIYNSPIKRHGGEVELDKRSEKLPYEQQAYESTQIASAFMYLLWGEFAQRYLPSSDTHQFKYLII